MLPDFGSRLNEIPFEPNDEVTNALIERYVVDAISRWEPRAAVLDTTITNTDDQVYVRIKVRVNLETFSVDFALDESLALVPIQ
jgi:uncharacterized protein